MREVQTSDIEMKVNQEVKGNTPFDYKLRVPK